MFQIFLIYYLLTKFTYVLDFFKNSEYLQGFLIAQNFWKGYGFLDKTF